jgi:small subunit ribosomal protein S17
MEATETVTTTAPAAATEENPRGRRKERVGVVVSDKMDKTITVAVYGWKIHQLYKKRVKHTRKFKAHDEKNECNIGDTVRIQETRPLSKTKRWRLVEIVKRAD